MGNSEGLALSTPSLSFTSEDEKAFGSLAAEIFCHPVPEILRRLGDGADGPAQDRSDPIAVGPEDASSEVEEGCFETGPSADRCQASPRQRRQTGPLGPHRRVGCRIVDRTNRRRHPRITAADLHDEGPLGDGRPEGIGTEDLGDP